jgi:flagellar protein FliO/FliZ
MNGELVWAVVRLLVALPLILGLAYLVLKYGLARRYMVTTGSHRMKLIEQLPLGPKTTLSLVSLGGRFYLLAHQDNAISLVKELAELKDPEETIVGDIVEFTPQTLEEFDRLQRPAGPGAAEHLPGVYKDKYRKQLNKLTGWLDQVGSTLRAKLTARKRPGG